MVNQAIKNRIYPVILAILRIAVGWHFLYEGLTKIFNPAWSARPYLEGSRWIFGDLFRWMASGDAGIKAIDIANEWGLTLIGLALILGIFTRAASMAGISMLVLYYVAYPPFGGYSYGAASEGSYLFVNKNLIELVCFLIIAVTRSGEYLGLEGVLRLRKSEDKQVPQQAAAAEESGMNKRRELIKGLAGLPILTGFAGLFLSETSGKNVDGVTSATLPRVTYKRIADLKSELPKGRLGDYEFSRLIMGCNLISGFAHARDLIYANTLFKAYNTDQKILETFHLAEMAGINATFITNSNFPVFNKYLKMYNGKMNTICQTYVLREKDLLADIDRAIVNGATTLYIQGGEADKLVREGRIKDLATAVEHIKKKGYLAGVGGHALEVIKTCEKEGIPADYYVKTFHHDKYWSAHPREQRVEFSVDSKKYLDHNLIHDNMFDLFSDQTAEFMMQVKKPWFAFKVLAGGAIQPADGFRYAFENGADFICVGMFDFQIIDDVNTAGSILKDLEKRNRPWYS